MTASRDGGSWPEGEAPASTDMSAGKGADARGETAGPDARTRCFFQEYVRRRSVRSTAKVEEEGSTETAIPTRRGCGSCVGGCGSTGASCRLQRRSCGHGGRGGGRRRSIGPARRCRSRRTRLARRCRWRRRRRMHVWSCSRCSRRGGTGRAKRPRGTRDRCLHAVARATPFLVTITTTHLGAVQCYVVWGLTVMTKPNLLKGRAFHTKMTDLRASRAGPERRRRRAPWTLRRGMPLVEAGGARGGAVGDG